MVPVLFISNSPYFELGVMELKSHPFSAQLHFSRNQLVVCLIDLQKRGAALTKQGPFWMTSCQSEMPATQARSKHLMIGASFS